ncbi:MAG: C10 family peptidase [Bacteroidales bacterium]|nr:C10 family peptidase [Bacteroidales bacterium]MBQ2550210.1 C10 family peptidase [Bacteroidales bacterium]
MKHLFPLILLFIILFACHPAEQAESPLVDKQGPIETKADIGFKVSYEEAKFFASIYRSAENIVSIDSVEREGEIVFYVVNYNNGWLIISGDKRTEIVLASSDSGSFKLSDIDSEPWLFWFNLTINGILSFIHNDVDEVFINANSISRWEMIDDIIGGGGKTVRTKSGDGDEYVWIRRQLSTTYNSETVEKPHLIQTKWGQKFPWNYHYPEEIDTNYVVQTCPVGCTAVAMAQVINYLHNKENVPTGLHHGASVTGISSFSNSYHGTFANGVLVDPSDRWPLFAKTKGTDALADSILFVREFMAEVGHSVGMEYHWNGSGAWPSVSAMNSFGLTMTQSYYSNPENSQNDYFTIVGELDNDLPIIVVEMYHELDGSSSGHTWIIDGYSYRSSCIQTSYLWEYRPNDGVDGPDYRAFTQQEAESYFDDPSDLHDGAVTYLSSPWGYEGFSYYMNWGWDGSNDESAWSYAPTVWCNINTFNNSPYEVHFYHEIEAF